MKFNIKGFLLIEYIIAVSLSVIIITAASYLMADSFKNWAKGESHFESGYNCKETINKLSNEIRDSYGVEIIDNSDKAWIKIYKSSDKKQFITFRLKNDKLFIGLNNTENPNSEFSNYIKIFRVKYLPNNANTFEESKGVNIYLLFEYNKNQFDIDTSIAYRTKQ